MKLSKDIAIINEAWNDCLFAPLIPDYRTPFSGVTLRTPVDDIWYLYNKRQHNIR